MTYSIAWSLFALGLLLVGMHRQTAAVRYAAIALFVVTLVKLFVHDLAQLDQLYRIGAFIAVRSGADRGVVSVPAVFSRLGSKTTQYSSVILSEAQRSRRIPGKARAASLLTRRGSSTPLRCAQNDPRKKVKRRGAASTASSMKSCFASSSRNFSMPAFPGHRARSGCAG